MPAHIPIDRQTIAEFCHRWHVVELGLFGSVLRDDFRPDSDVDVFVTFAEGCTPGWEIVTMQDELASLLGRRVDLSTKRALSPRLAKRILATAEVIFAA
jgi:predicted nucleotidyltransferase